MKEYIIIRNGTLITNIKTVYGIERAYRPGDIVLEIDYDKDAVNQKYFKQTGGYIMVED